jgi:hypothetical protein
MSEYTENLFCDLVEEVRAIRYILTPRLSATLRIHRHHHHGDHHMPATLTTVGQTASSLYQEWDGPNGSGNPLSPAGPVSYATSDASIATVDASSGQVTAVANGTATITGSDSANGLSASDIVTVAIAAAAQSATLVITADTAQPK